MEIFKTHYDGDIPTLINIRAEALSNSYYRRELWTGEHLQTTVMSIPVGGEVGLERHEDFDQFLFIERGIAAVYFGDTKQGVKFAGNANPEYMIAIPAKTWHNIINDGSVPLKLCSVYAPPHHPAGTLQKTKFDSDLADY